MRKTFVLILVGLQLAATGCEMKDALDATNSMPAKMDQTNEAVRLQKIAIAKDGMEDPQNAVPLLPIPTNIIPWAETFAENATIDEVTGQTYLYLKEVNDGIHPQDVDDAGNPKDLTAQEINEINNYKMHRFTIAEAVAGFLPQPFVERLVVEQIYNEGRFYSTTMEILMMRFRFLRDALLTNSLLSKSMVSVGELEKAVEYVSYMDWIAKRPFLNQIELKVTGFLPPYGEFYENISEESAKEAMLDMLKKIGTRAEKVQTLVKKNDSTKDQQKLTQQARIKSKLNQTAHKLNLMINYWMKK